MELKWLEDFVSLANTGSFSRSAEERNVTQPAFSRRIRALEVWLGAELIDRSTYPTTLTAAGRAFRGTTEEVLTLLGQQRDAFRLERSRTHAAVRFAALHTISLTFFPRWLREVEAALGPLTTRLVPGNLHDCVEALSEGDCDFLLCFAHEAVPIMVDPALFPSVLVARDRLVPVAPAAGGGSNFPGTPDHPVRMLAYSSDCFLGRIVEQIQQRNPAHHFEVCYENSMAEALKAMALEGHGAAWLPMSSIGQELTSGALVRLAGAEWELPLDVRLYRSSARLRPAAAALWSHAVARTTTVPGAI
ncbi:MAG TPA: LysR substrate-binding domain-containing protein [Aliidongia sp.]|uniref:LysR substrate-binding domain-containing protein n=1 Tax=Aliidongia sp. TaxID=1914230 RepID=UPI002DDD828C|nr:LysR substrate-binding domain-containing protein [Aliidongia sp.]HEV2677026.1 LysR substrate-binding domain-containing protein [Aliidongia sp.]